MADYRTGRTDSFLDPWVHNELLGLETNLLATATFKADEMSHAYGQRHLKEGFLQRHLMMTSARLFIYEAAKDHEGALTPLLNSRLNVFLNSFYLNLRGAIDNLAWALAYELELRDNIDENSRESQYFCYLFGLDFLDALNDKNSFLSNYLSQFRDWFDELKALRDPAAHRIPLTFPESILPSDEHDEWKRKQDESVALTEEASEALENGDFKGARELIERATDLQLTAANLGQFQPIIVTSEVSGREIKSAPHQMQEDQLTFLKVSRSVVRAL